MKRTTNMRASVAGIVVVGLASVANAQPIRVPTRPAPTNTEAKADAPEGASSLRKRVGLDRATQLLDGSDGGDPLRGIARLSSLGTPEAIALLARRAGNASTSLEALALARALAPHADRDGARIGLLRLLGGRPTPERNGEESDDGDDGDDEEEDDDESERPPRKDDDDTRDANGHGALARQTAALALARTQDMRAIEPLYGLAVTAGPAQGAARFALAASPPKSPAFYELVRKKMSLETVRLLGRTGDLRAIEPLHAAAVSGDVERRAAAIRALAALGDARALDLAKRAVADTDVRLREAGARALVALGAEERVGVVARLVEDPATVALGAALAHDVHHPEITKRLAERARPETEPDVRSLAIAALGRSPDPNAASTLAKLLAEPGVGYEAALALARSPAPNATSLLADAASGPARALAARAWIVRSLLRHERHAVADDRVFALARSADPTERAIGTFARVALAGDAAGTFLSANEARVRRAAILATFARTKVVDEDALLAHRKDPDAFVHALLVARLAGSNADADHALTTTELFRSAEAGGPDALPAIEAVARRTHTAIEATVKRWLSSDDPLVRAHAARGLGAASYPRATGWLAEAYATESNTDVRRALVAALAARTADAKAGARREALEAARLDPDAAVARTARAAIGNLALRSEDPTSGGEIAWIRLVSADGTKPDRVFSGVVIGSDGAAIPVVFDDDGHALVAGLPPGPYRLVLASGAPSYDASSR